jgi:hypothetical protein
MQGLHVKQNAFIAIALIIITMTGTISSNPIHNGQEHPPHPEERGGNFFLLSENQKGTLAFNWWS